MQFFRADEVVSLSYHKGIYRRFSDTVLRSLGGTLKSSHEVEGQAPIQIWEFEDESSMAVGDAFASAVEPIDLGPSD